MSHQTRMMCLWFFNVVNAVESLRIKNRCECVCACGMISHAIWKTVVMAPITAQCFWR